MGTLMGSTVVSTLIAFIDLFIIIVKKVKNSCWNDNKVQQFRANHQEADSHVVRDYANAISREYEAQMKSKEENKTNRSGNLNIKIEILFCRLNRKDFILEKFIVNNLTYIKF